MIGTKCVVWVSVKETQDMQINSQNYSELEELGKKNYSYLSQNLRETWKSASVG